MEVQKVPLQKLISELLIVLIVGTPVLFLFLFATAYQRGFYCDDESLRHPFKDSTVPSYYLYIFGLGLNLIAMVSLEYIGHKSQKKVQICGFQIPYWLWRAYCAFLVFCFGALCSQLITDGLKYSIGRLRPHFYTLCQPRFNGMTCENESIIQSNNFHRYIIDFECTNPEVLRSERKLKEMRLSFPSGHSSFSMYTMLYLAIYLQKSIWMEDWKLLKHFLQFLFVFLSLLTGMSRISDYKHHWSDVLSGFFIGASVALITAKVVSPLFSKKEYREDQSNLELNNITPNNGMTV